MKAMTFVPVSETRAQVQGEAIQLARQASLAHLASGGLTAARLYAAAAPPEAAVPEPALGVVVEWWGAAAQEVGRTLAERLALRGLSAWGCSVDEFVEKAPQATGLSSAEGAIHLFAVWCRRPELTAQEAQSRWDEHVPLALKVHAGAASYVRNRVTSSHAGTSDWDGVSALTFPTVDDFVHRRYVPADAKSAITADIARFIARFEVMLMRELPLV